MPSEDRRGAAAIPAFCASAISESVPPSPLLSVRSMEDDVFPRHDDGQRPEHQRDDADDLVALARRRWPPSGLRGRRIERAGADVAIDDPMLPQRQRPERRPWDDGRRRPGSCRWRPVRCRSSRITRFAGNGPLRAPQSPRRYESLRRRSNSRLTLRAEGSCRTPFPRVSGRAPAGFEALGFGLSRGERGLSGGERRSAFSTPSSSHDGAAVEVFDADEIDAVGIAAVGSMRHPARPRVAGLGEVGRDEDELRLAVVTARRT